MRLSVVVPSYNQGRFLQATLDSILSQDVDAEILVYDGGSYDDSLSILERYADRIEYVSQKDDGQADAINQGLQHASGEILAYLNSDDVYCQGALKEVLDYFASHEDCTALYGDAWHLHEDGSIMAPYNTEPWSYSRLMEVCFLCQPATFWRRELMERVGLFDPTLRYVLDYEYWLRAGREINFHYLQGVFLAGSRLYAETKTLGRREEAHHETMDVVMRYIHEPPYKWLQNFGWVMVELEQQKNGGHEIDNRTRHSLFVQAVLNIADQHRIPLSLDFLDALERLLPGS